MEGVIKKTDVGWVIEYYQEDAIGLGCDKLKYYSLHPDDVEQIRKDSLMFDDIEGRINAHPHVVFYELDGYAKLVPYQPKQTTSAMLCEHANEVPMECKCSDDCYCKENTCRVDTPRERAIKRLEWLKMEANRLEKELNDGKI